MPRKNTRTGIVLILLFGLALAVWNVLSPSGGPVSNAGLVGGGQNRAVDEGSATTRDGFKGSDEELQAVTADR